MKKSVETIVNVVLGTAGHIDHGKSTLVERLTGIHPDRLPEEKARGLTIDLGFAPLVLPSGQRVGMIDVPGHERLVKNMVAGATGIDLVLLVVAADDGVMPQTREHVSIMQLLGIEQGIVVLTKIDLVDQDLRELVKEDLRETLRGTFFESAPVMEVSSVTGEGIDRLLAEIHSRVASLRPRDTSGIFRMPVQRVFSSKGFGTVLTGVPVSGQAAIGDALELVPLGKKGRVRGIHAYREATDLARAGHSSAINLTDIDYREAHRGMVLTQPGYFQGANMFEAKLDYLPTNERPLPHQAPIRLHVGTVEALGRVYLLEKKTVEPGETAYVQFRLDDSICAAPGDRFIVRLNSPLQTIGGGEILDQSRWRLKLGKDHVLELLRDKEEAVGEPKLFAANVLFATGHSATSEKDLGLRCGLDPEAMRGVVAALLAEGSARQTGRGGLLVSTRRLAAARGEALRKAELHFRENPRRLHLDKQQLRQALGADEPFFQELLHDLEKEGVATEVGAGKLRFRDYGPRLDPAEQARRAELVGAIARNEFTPPSPAELSAQLGADVKTLTQLADLACEEGELVKLAEEVYLHRSALEAARNRLRAHLEANKLMTASDAKNVLGSTRKYIIPLLEFLDREGFTVRRGDTRELKKT